MLKRKVLVIDTRYMFYHGRNTCERYV
jgi:hypothetical protein